MNKFVGQILITKKWVTQAKASSLQTQNPWIIFEKGYLQRTSDDLAKIRSVKEDLRKYIKELMPDYNLTYN